MKTKMNLDVVAENEEERKIEKFINMLHASKEVQEFLQTMDEEAKRRNVFKYRARIKNPASAIRTYRINKKNLDNAHDYIGITFITNTEEEIYPIIDYIKKLMPDADYVDFVAEETIYSPLVYIKWVPPLGYNVLAKEKLIPNQKAVPIEIRVCSKQGFISEQAAYYSVKKNDTIKLPLEQINHLRDLVQHITYKLALLNTRALTEEEREKHERDLNKLLTENKEFLQANQEPYKDAILDLGRLIYECEHDEIVEEKRAMSNDSTNDAEDDLKEKFGELFDTSNGDMITRVCKSIEKLRKLGNFKKEEKCS